MERTLLILRELIGNHWRQGSLFCCSTALVLVFFVVDLRKRRLFFGRGQRAALAGFSATIRVASVVAGFAVRATAGRSASSLAFVAGVGTVTSSVVVSAVAASSSSVVSAIAASPASVASAPGSFAAPAISGEVSEFAAVVALDVVFVFLGRSFAAPGVKVAGSLAPLDVELETAHFFIVEIFLGGVCIVFIVEFDEGVVALELHVASSESLELFLQISFSDVL